MRLFYILIIFIGIFTIVGDLLVSYAIPPDVNVAKELSQSPDQWSLQLNENTKNKLSDYDVKGLLLITLKRRANFIRNIQYQFLWFGLACIFFSIIGLIREKQINKETIDRTNTST